MSDELDRMLEASHDGITVFDFDGMTVPCVIFEVEKYDRILSLVAGRPVSIDTNLNILQDGLGHVFVEVTLAFSISNITEKILVNADKHLDFFESLAKTSMLAISSPKSHYGADNVFMINLPRPDRAEDALDIICKGLANGRKD